MEIQSKVDPRKKRIILVVHGVQAGDDEKLDQHRLIKKLVDDRLGDIKVNYDTSLYRYENINDAAQKGVRKVFSLFSHSLLTGKIIDPALDVMLDVVINLKNGKTAKKIREGLKHRILEYFNLGYPLYIAAHSLGTVYSFDVVNELMRDPQFFGRDNRKSWPVQGMITMGSPLGLGMFKRSKVYDMGPGRKPFVWKNYWDRTDPVVSGSIYGRPMAGYCNVESFARGKDCGWLIRDHIVDIGKTWLMSHVGYWNHPLVGDDLVYMITH